jgi:uridine kinase
MKTITPARLVAITGGSGAGKSWLADKLQHLFGNQAGRIAQDSFYRDRSHLPPAERSRLNFDHPDALDWDCFRETLEAIRAGRETRMPVYDFSTHCRGLDEQPLVPRPIMIVDGLWLLHRPEIRRLFSLSIFMPCPETERLRRRVTRDTAERGRTAPSVRRQFRDTVAPMHRLFVEPQARHAQLVIPSPLPAIGRLHSALWRLLPDETVKRNWSRTVFRTELETLLLPAA